jgi:hypothetical protein
MSRRVTTRGDSRIRIVSRRSPIGDSCSSLPARETRRDGGVEHQVGDAQHLGADLAAVAADQRAHARFQFLDREGLDQVVVGARLPGPVTLSPSVSRAVSISTGVAFFDSARRRRHNSMPSMRGSIRSSTIAS